MVVEEERETEELLAFHIRILLPDRSRKGKQGLLASTTAGPIMCRQKKKKARTQRHSARIPAFRGKETNPPCQRMAATALRSIKSPEKIHTASIKANMLPRPDTYLPTSCP